MSKIPKFLLCKNDAAQPGALFLFHTQRPRFVGKIVIFDQLQDFEKWQLSPPSNAFCSISGNKSFVGTRTTVNNSIIAMYVVEFIDEPGSEIPADGEFMHGGLMARTGDWMHSYFKDNKA